jgi:pyroglutamyl-peptidase
MLASSAATGRSPSTVLVTGFDPFGGSAVNPSALAVQRIASEGVPGARVVAAILPTVFGRSADMLLELVREQRPDLVVCTGQAGGRTAISLERVAINVNDARIPDNAGAQPVDTPVVTGGPAAFFTTLPIKAMHAALLGAGIRSEVSQTAGTFVCNHVFYALLHELHTNPALAATRGGLVHVPWIEGQGTPFMTLQMLVDGLVLAIRRALQVSADIHIQAGALA